MTVTSATLRQLADLRLDADQMSGVLRVLADQAEADEARRAAQAERKRRQRDKERDSHVTVTGQSNAALSPKENPHTPKEITPIPTNPNPNGLAPLPVETNLAIDAYSAMAARAGLAVPRIVSGARHRRVEAIVRVHGLATWLEAVAKVEASDFCRGANDRGWKADLDFITQAKSFAGLLEGRYDNRARGSPPASQPKVNSLQAAIERKRAAQNGNDGRATSIGVPAVLQLSDFSRR